MSDAEISDGGVHGSWGWGDIRLKSWRPPGRALSARQERFLPGWCQSPGGAGVWVPRRGPTPPVGGRSGGAASPILDSAEPSSGLGSPFCREAAEVKAPAGPIRQDPGRLLGGMGLLSGGLGTKCLISFFHLALRLQSSVCVTSCCPQARGAQTLGPWMPTVSWPWC